MEIILFLHRRDRPVATNDIMKALRIKNWATATKTLRMLEEARLVTKEERSVGRYKSKANLWAIEPKFGARIAELLEKANLLSQEALASSYEPPKMAERPGIVDIESAGERLVTILQEAVNVAAGNR